MGFWQTLGVLAIGAAAAVMIIAYLSYEKFINWFQVRLTPGDKNRVGYSVIKSLNSGNFTTAVGVFNPQTQEMYEQEITESQSIDPRIIEAHDSDCVASWTA